MPTLQQSRVLWLFSGILLLEVAISCGGTMGVISCSAAVVAGLRGEVLDAMAVALTLVGYSLGAIVVLRGFFRAARRSERCIPWRWLIPGMLSAPIAAPFWGVCMIFIIESRTNSESVRIAADNTMYSLVLATVLPLALGVPYLLGRLYRKSRLNSPTALMVSVAIMPKETC